MKIKEKSGQVKPSAALLIAALFTLALAVFAILQSQVRINNQGTVKALGVGVYWNSNCTNPVSLINWGTVEPGSINNVTVYVRNEGNTAANISMTTENWNPSNASNYLTLSWNYNGQQLNPSEVVQITLSLAVSSNVQGIESFSFDIIVSVIE
ncbi:MAG: hypothetical protein ACPLW8_01160 [Candidatus Bathyarchaeales archaeon]